MDEEGQLFSQICQCVVVRMVAILILKYIRICHSTNFHPINNKREHGSRQNFEAKKHKYVCSRHFSLGDFSE